MLELEDSSRSEISNSDDSDESDQLSELKLQSITVSNSSGLTRRPSQDQQIKILSNIDVLSRKPSMQSLNTKSSHSMQLKNGRQPRYARLMPRTES